MGKPFVQRSQAGAGERPEMVDRISVASRERGQDKSIALTLNVDQARYEALKVLGARTRRSNQEILLAALDAHLQRHAIRPAIVSEKLTAAELRDITDHAEQLIAVIAPTSLGALRNRAIIGVMGYAWASVEAVLAIRVRDYYCIGDQRWVRFIEKKKERHEL